MASNTKTWILEWRGPRFGDKWDTRPIVCRTWCTTPCDRTLEERSRPTTPCISCTGPTRPHCEHSSPHRRPCPCCSHRPPSSSSYYPYYSRLALFPASCSPGTTHTIVSPSRAVPSSRSSPCTRRNWRPKSLLSALYSSSRCPPPIGDRTEKLVVSQSEKAVPVLAQLLLL